ncbi:Ano7, partial [Symbiodinium microadriaticum]
ILNVIYQDLAVYLTNNENHRTDTQYEDALIAKLFAFQFVNSYASFVYIAFIKTTIGDPCQGSCMSELSVALVTIF